MRLLSKVAIGISTIAVSGSVLAHGYISEPASRDQMCRDARTPNQMCGQAQYEPQSVGEGPDGFPVKGPKDGELASGSGESNWIGSELNVQSSDRWVKHKVQAGPRNITWTFSAAHPIADFKYYITKQDWNPNIPLTREAFELTPFCVVPGGPAASEGKTTHSCVLPERTGYQIIYGAWDVSDTASTFYKIIDVEYDEVASVWKRNIGIIQPSRTLDMGDKVKVRLFDANGEREDLAITLAIDSLEMGEPNRWAMALAEKINASHQDIRSGVKNKDGEVIPAAGSNTVYAKAESTITRVEIQITAQEDTRPGLVLSNTQQEYPIASEGRTVLQVDAQVRGEMVLNGKVYNLQQENVGFGSVVVKDSSASLPITMWKAEDGAHTVVVEGRMRDGKTFQQSFETRLVSQGGVAEYDYVYPQSIEKYTAGTKVLQSSTNEVFECKPFPFSGWCTINSHHYVPGVGSNWQDAWTLMSGNHKH